MDYEAYLNYIDEAILIVDHSFDIVGYNAAFHAIFPTVKKAEFILSCIDKRFCSIIFDSMSLLGSTERVHFEYDSNEYIVNILDIYAENSKETIARAFVLTNVTSYKLLADTAMENNLLLQKSTETLRAQKENLVSQSQLKEKIASASETEAILRELHDTLGHSLTVLNALNRLALIESETDSVAVCKDLVETYRLAQISLTEFDTLGVLSDESDSKSITAFIYHLKQSVSIVSLKMNITITGKEDASHVVLFYPVSRVIQEAVTNCLRHANATELFLSIEFRTDSIRIFIEDNGTVREDPENLQKGNGLTGMEKRVKESNGQIEIGINKNGLFIRAFFPL